MQTRSSEFTVTCTELLVVDQAPFLKKALSTCRRLRKELDKKQGLLAHFEDEDRAAFQRWLNSTHGATLTQVRELRDEVSAYQFILHHLSHCAYHSFEDVPKLYQELFQLKKKGMLYSYVPPEVEDSVESDDANDEGDDAWGDVFEDEEDEDWTDADRMRDFFDRAFGDGRAGSGYGEEELRAASARKAANDARLKSCYRQLAKRLHPDHSELEESVREKRWHEIQEAYHNSDLEGLLRVEAVCDMDEEGLSVKLGLARLRDLAAYQKAHLLPIREALRAAKKDIAFGFSQRGPSPEVEYEIAGGLKFERIDLKAAVADLARAAKSIRNEVEAELKASEIRTAKAALRRGQRQAPQVKTPATSGKNAERAKDAEQMTFF
ncbi:J domain-containing protein [Coraliomargarita sp. SDUM461003]|uniref:J domain-containing protein n=1 Tax=Thalassobacterium maritimum TaxID=3041265 RepID=A0ABU1APC8_9BACT|nr:J domain-containing protein [Coraliomargarita sp. SDUM461003]MDQ8206021.1 J domain-containing protein [Coraliomargarita sp. SDUM461003]